MHFGVPVIGSDRDFCRDVCGEAALYPDPLSPASIRDAIVRLRDEAGLRRRLVEAGREQLRRFPRDWEQIAAKVLDLEGIAHQWRERAAAT
jgi:glycosyltransferase involved in cell wall biosynthesis